MTYLDWPTESVAFYGPPGGLVRIPIPDGAQITESQDDGWVFRRAISGRVVGQRLSLSRRTWEVKLPPLPDSDLAAFAGLRLRQYADLGSHWITPDMMASNLVDPRWGAFTEIRNSAYYLGGPWRSPDGVEVAASLRSETPEFNDISIMGTMIAPPEGEMLNVSAFIGAKAGGAGTIQLRWKNLADQTITSQNSFWTDGGIARVDVTSRVPEGAVAYEVWAQNATFIAGAQATWSDRMLDYGIPSGCAKAAMSDPGRALDGIVNGEPYRTVSFQVTEVG